MDKNFICAGITCPLGKTNIEKELHFVSAFTAIVIDGKETGIVFELEEAKGIMAFWWWLIMVTA